MRNIKLVIEYDGTAYCGWQRQINGLAIQQVLEESITRITGEEVRVMGSGRTDAGVHAMGQVANFHTGSPLSERSLLLGINSVLPKDMVTREICEMPADFNACSDALSKVYLYRICNRSVRPALEKNRAWFIWEPLDPERMAAVLPVFQGTHDFTSFCSTHTDSEDHVRTILAITVAKDPDGMIQIEMEADGFLRYMVRTITGMLVACGRGKCSPETAAEILAAKDRRRAGITAPPQGLFLKEVKYRLCGR
jgi:tRNA pseudouridine38-40 synthase